MRTISPQEGRKRSDESPVRLNGFGIRGVGSPDAKVSIPIHTEPCGIDGWIDKISRAWKGGPENTLGLARLLHRAGRSMEHGQWSRLWQSERVPFSKPKAETLVIIGQGLGGTNIATLQEIPIKLGTGCNPRSFSKVMDNIAQTDLQGLGDSQQCINGWDLVAALDLANVNWIKVHPFGELLLGQPFQLPIFSDAVAQKFSIFSRNHFGDNRSKAGHKRTDSNSYHFVLAFSREGNKTAHKPVWRSELWRHAPPFIGRPNRTANSSSPEYDKKHVASSERNDLGSRTNSNSMGAQRKLN